MKILLDGKTVKTLVPESLPLLIHGEDGSGASLYTIALAAQWASQGRSVLCLCGYPMAEKAFMEITGGEMKGAEFYTQEKLPEFLQRAKTAPADAVMIIKNIELFDRAILGILAERRSLIVSGNLEKSAIKDEIGKLHFITRVFFSSFADVTLPQLAKYEGLVLSGDYRGTTKLA